VLLLLLLVLVLLLVLMLLTAGSSILLHTARYFSPRSLATFLPSSVLSRTRGTTGSLSYTDINEYITTPIQERQYLNI
jgi:hypothetical protein